jgi:drug/metabolite transporter (DMT)-like permease
MLVHTNFIEAGLWRYLFAVICLLIMTGKSLPSFSELKSNVRGVLIVGVAGLFAFNIFLFAGMKNSSAVNASLLISLSPIFTIFLSCLFFHTALQVQHVAGGAISFAGILYLLVKGDLKKLFEIQLAYGDVLILLATLISSFYHLWVKKYATHMNHLHFTFLTNVVCFISFAVVFPFCRSSDPMQLSVTYWVIAVVFGCFGTAFTYLFWNKGVAMIGAGKGGLFMNVVPLSTAVIGVLLGDTIRSFHMYSGTLIIAGLILSQFRRRG